ncbi:hypothetical protein [Streptomyces cuspidosporus]|uniref:Uncharacterized protein n=1 Tax=Streptomyces cuspidosporus TaxID=66882 RepID=A0ABP5TQ88_9ACTN
MSSHARKNQARQYRDQHKVTYTAGLQQIRDCLPPAQGATRAALAPSWTADTVPQELLVAVEQHCHRTSSYCHRAVQVGREYRDCLREWQRLVSYALTDAHAHSQLLIGTIAAFLQQQGVEDDLIRRHLQSPSPDRYITRDALAHLAGLLGRPLPEGTVESSWYSIGRAIAQRDSAE